MTILPSSTYPSHRRNRCNHYTISKYIQHQFQACSISKFLHPVTTPQEPIQITLKTFPTILTILLQSLILLQSQCNLEIQSQWKNKRAGVYRTRGQSSARPFSDRGPIPGTHRKLPPTCNPSAIPSTTQTDGSSSKRHRVRLDYTNPTISSSLDHATTQYCQSTCNPKSWCNSHAILQSTRNRRTHGPEYIEPGRSRRPVRSPIAVGFRDCARILP